VYRLEMYQNLPSIGWTGITSVDLGTDRHTALTNPLIEEVVQAETQRSPWRTYYAIKRTN
jgi:hypothetical protein